MKNETKRSAGYAVGQQVKCNGGYPGTIIEVCSWADGMVVVRLASGAVCVDVTDLR